MALMELKLRQIYAGQECINVFNYVSNGTPASVSLSFALVSAWGAIPSAGVYPSTSILQTLRALQSANVSYDFIEGKDVYSVTDFYATAFNPTLPGLCLERVCLRRQRSVSGQTARARIFGAGQSALSVLQKRTLARLGLSLAQRSLVVRRWQPPYREISPMLTRVRLSRSTPSW